VKELVEYGTEVISEEDKYYTMRQIIFQQYIRADFYNSSLLETIIENQT